MKKIIGAVFLCFLGFSAFAYDIFAKANLKGSPKSVVKTDFSIASKFGEYYRTPSSKTVANYSTDGKLLEFSELTARDVLVNKVSNTYDTAGKLIEQVCVDSNNSQIWKNVISYNKNGLKNDSSEYSKAGMLKSKTIYVYKDNRLIDETFYNGEGALVWKIIYKYNEKNQLESEDEYFQDGSLSEERHYTYLENGMISSISYVDASGVQTSKDVFRYADNGTLSEVTTYGQDNKVLVRTFVKFDEKGNPSKITVYNICRKFGTTVNELAEQSEISYSYDSMGNAK